MSWWVVGQCPGAQLQVAVPFTLGHHAPLWHLVVVAVLGEVFLGSLQCVLSSCISTFYILSDLGFTSPPTPISFLKKNIKQ